MVFRQTDARDRFALPRWQRRLEWACFPAFLLAASLLGPGSVAAVTVQEALAYNPVQKEVEYEQPTQAELGDCSIDTEQVEDAPALVRPRCRRSGAACLPRYER